MREIRRVLFDFFWIGLSGALLVIGMVAVWKMQITNTVITGDYALASVIAILGVLFLYVSIEDLHRWWHRLPSLDKKGVGEA